MKNRERKRGREKKGKGGREVEKPLRLSRKIKRFGVIIGGEVLPGEPLSALPRAAVAGFLPTKAALIHRTAPSAKKELDAAVTCASGLHVRGSYARFSFSPHFFASHMLFIAIFPHAYAHARVLLHPRSPFPTPCPLFLLSGIVSTASGGGPRFSFTKAILQTARNLVARIKAREQQRGR